MRKRTAYIVLPGVVEVRVIASQLTVVWAPQGIAWQGGDPARNPTSRCFCAGAHDGHERLRFSD
jgi:hypothetical protein